MPVLTTGAGTTSFAGGGGPGPGVVIASEPWQVVPALIAMFSW